MIIFSVGYFLGDEGRWGEAVISRIVLAICKENAYEVRSITSPEGVRERERGRRDMVGG